MRRLPWSRKAPTRGGRFQAGFTLLEVMISLAILAIALVAISDLNGGAVTMHAYGRRATEATLLLRGKMLDVEDDLQKNGFSDFDDEKHGTFEEDGSPSYSWKAEILKPDVQLDPGQLLSMLGVGGNASGKGGAGGIGGAGAALAGVLGGGGAGALGGGGAGALAGGGAAALLSGPMAGMLQGQAKTFIETLKRSVREIRLTVSWQDGKSARGISASQMIVILPETVGKAGQSTGTAPIAPGLNGQPQAGPGQPSSDPGAAK